MLLAKGGSAAEDGERARAIVRLRRTHHVLPRGERVIGRLVGTGHQRVVAQRERVGPHGLEHADDLDAHRKAFGVV
jgi:hypothetical protein